MRLGIGTAQFGLDYGVSNQLGKTPLLEIQHILSYAKLNSIKYLDTAAGYGESEQALGNLPQSQDFQVITKTPALKDCLSATDARNRVRETFLNSLKNLKRDRVHGLMLHNARDILSSFGEEIFQELVNLRAQKLVERIGFSTYDPDEARIIISRYDFDLVQCPVNILDQRFITSNILSEMKKKRMTIFARSAFLQGLLLLKRGEVPSYFSQFNDKLGLYYDYVEKQNLSPLELCLKFALSCREIDVVVCGVNNLEQLNELVRISSSEDLNDRNCSFLNSNDLDLINPSKWKITGAHK